MLRSCGSNMAASWCAAVRLLRVFLGLLTIIVAAGCAASGSATFRLSLLRDSALSPHWAGTDVRRGRQCAVVAFNSFVYSRATAATGEPAEEARVTGPELRGLTDAMHHSFLGALYQVPGLAVMSVPRIESNRYYRHRPYLAGNVTTKEDLPLSVDLGRMVAPVGLKFINVPNAQLDMRLYSSGLQGALDRVISDLNDTFLEDANLLTRKLGVDFTLFVNNKIRLIPAADGKWQAELELVEVTAVGQASARDFAYARYVGGRFHDRANDTEPAPVRPEILALMQMPGQPALATTNFTANRWWRDVAGPYQNIAELFRQDLARLRR